MGWGMVKCVIDSDNVEFILLEIKNSHDPVFDFSGTDFIKLSEKNPSVIFDVFQALAVVERPFSLKLNLCKLDDKNEAQLKELMDGLRHTKKMIGFEFIRSLDPECPIRVLEDIANSLIENHSIKRITIDGFQVTPPHVCEVLKSHPTVLVVIINGLPQKLNRQPTNDDFFKTASTSREMIQNIDFTPTSMLKNRSK
jgi:hypothetical protein